MVAPAAICAAAVLRRLCGSKVLDSPSEKESGVVFKIDIMSVLRHMSKGYIMAPVVSGITTCIGSVVGLGFLSMRVDLGSAISRNIRGKCFLERGFLHSRIDQRLRKQVSGLRKDMEGLTLLTP